MKRFFLCFTIVAILLAASCNAPKAPPPSAAVPAADRDATLYGFFPSPPDVTTESVINMYKAMGRHADVVMLQWQIPWLDFVAGPDAESAAIVDLKNQMILAEQNGLDALFLIDPLNGLNRREFNGLPGDWEASFANPDVRSAFTNFALRIVREFQPEYLGLASEINTYADFLPEDFPHYLSLYNSVYDMIKAEAPDTKIFVTFQWEEMNNLIPGLDLGEPYDINWQMIEQFEPKLDAWAISSYPFVVFQSGGDIPADYYAPLLSRTQKPLLVAEGGYTSRPVGPFPGTPHDQVNYLNAIHSQIGGDRLAYWIYLHLFDINMDAYAEVMNRSGRGEDVNTLAMFASVGLSNSDGTPKPALEVWDSFRAAREN